MNSKTPIPGTQHLRSRRRRAQSLEFLDGSSLRLHRGPDQSLRPPARNFADRARMPSRATCSPPACSSSTSCSANNQALHAIDQVWNANPLREVVPVDWAEIARALRIVWLRSLRDPAKALTAAVDLNTRSSRAAIEAWTEAGTALVVRRRATPSRRASPTSGSPRRSGRPTRPTAP